MIIAARSLMRSAVEYVFVPTFNGEMDMSATFRFDTPYTSVDDSFICLQFYGASPKRVTYRFQEVATELTNRLVIFGSVEDVRSSLARKLLRRQQRFPPGNQDDQQPLSLDRNSCVSKNFGRLFVSEVERNNIGWIIQESRSKVKVQSFFAILRHFDMNASNKTRGKVNNNWQLRNCEEGY